MVAYGAVTAHIPETDANGDTLSRLAVLCVFLVERAMRRANREQARKRAGGHHDHDHDHCDDPAHCTVHGHHDGH
jgi:hypothetical protein